MAVETPRNLESTPTWAVAAVCSILIIISIFLDYLLEFLPGFLKRRKRKSLNQAVQNIKAELMLMGFVSLLLTVTQEPISKICVSQGVGDSFSACKNLNTMDSTETDENSTCEKKGMVSFISKDALHQLHIFIFVLAVFHVLYCVLTLALGIAKMRRWKSWEEETRTVEYQFSNDPRRFRLTHQTSFGRRHLKFWSSHPALLWPACFLRQFFGSVSKSDYFTLRHGFIMAHLSEGSKFDFQKYVRRALDEDFGLVVGISPWIWMVSIFLIFFKARVFYSHLWLPFLPLAMVLAVGTKLQHTITTMCLESREESTVVRGTFLVKPNDNLFWFGRPQWLLHLIHFILFQNSFQLAFFTWTWYEFGLNSCFHKNTEEFALWIAMGLLVELLCGYVTLPLYALVTQMGSSMKKSVFTERVSKGLKNWHTVARRNMIRSKTSSAEPSPELSPSYTVDTPVSDGKELDDLELDYYPLHVDATSLSIEIEEVEPNPKTGIRETYNGEISFGW